MAVGTRSARNGGRSRGEGVVARGPAARGEVRGLRPQAPPRLGGLILAVADDPQHVRAWQTGAVGEEEFGRRLSGYAGPKLKVLHDRKIPRSSANIDHLAVTSQCVWVGWGKAIRERLGEEVAGPLPVDGVAKRLARQLRAG